MQSQDSAVKVEKIASFTHQGIAALDQLIAKRLGNGEDKLINALRSKAALRAQQRAWPAADEEEWRRSRLSAFDFDSLLYGYDGVANLQSSDALIPDFLCKPVDPLDFDGCAELQSDDFSGMVKVKLGHSSVEYSLDVKSKGLYVGLLGDKSVPSALAAKALNILEDMIARSDNRFQSWNLAAYDLALLVCVEKNQTIEKPLVIDWQLSGEDKVLHGLVIVVLEESSSLTVLEHQSGSGGFLLNDGRYANVAANAQLNWNLVRNVGDEEVVVSHGHIVVERDARLKFAQSELGGGWVKTRLATDLAGEGADVHLEGLYFGHGSQHVDLRTVQNHLAPRASSRALYKGVVRDEARTIYQGLIFVAPGANKTDAYLNNRNLVLNDGARADSIPTLEIRTDDVKCSHGSTTSKLLDEHLFYLQNRGFSVKDAKAMLIEAFLGQVSGSMSELVQTKIQAVVLGRVEDV